MISFKTPFSPEDVGYYGVRLTVLNDHITRMIEAKELIGGVFGQKSQLVWDIPPMDSFNMNTAIYSISDKDFKQTLEKLTELFDLKDIVEKPTRVLPSGNV